MSTPLNTYTQNTANQTSSSNATSKRSARRKRECSTGQYTPNQIDPSECRQKRRKRLAEKRLASAGPLLSGAHSLQCGHFSEEYINALKASYPHRSYYGPPEYECRHCHAVFWYAERIKSDSSQRNRRIVYNNCCKGGKVTIPPFRDRPEPLASLAKFDGDAQSKKFMKNIRQYNCLFAFTSMGANIDRSMNDGRGPPVFKINGQVHHRIGSLLPPDGSPPKYIQLYIYDTKNEVQNRIQALSSDETPNDALDPNIVESLMKMLDEHNPFAKTLRLARDRLAEYGNEELRIRIIGAKEGDPVQYNLPTTEQLAMLVVGDFTLDTFQRDIIIQTKAGRLQHISSLHPAFMALQYPLLFPFGERGFQVGVLYTGVNPTEKNARLKMTMQDYARYEFHYRKRQPNPYLCYGALSTQARIDIRACIDENRLWFILNNQSKLRVENLQGIADAVGRGCIDGSEMGKLTVLPASHTGGRRYMIQNYHDGMAICRVYGPPDFFTTFTCNSKWREIEEGIFEPGQKATDRADIVVRVYNMKLEEMLQDIKDGTAFGPVDAACNMSYKLLSALRLNDHYARICVRVTRKWEYRGPADDGPVLHADLVLADHEGNSMYAEIPQELLADYNDHIQESHIYEIRRFRVANAKSFYNAVDARFMIYFTIHTQIVNPTNPPTTYPRYTYSLTSFEQLPMVVGNVQKFVDVLGIIVEINGVEMVQPPNGHAPTPTKKLILRDASGLETPLTLWGQRAEQFSINGVYNNDDPRPVIVLFVGCLMKTFQGQDYLSGSSACKWYFNPDIPDVPEAEELYNRYGDERIEIRHGAPAPAPVVQPQPPVQQETRYLQDLLAIDPYEFPQNGCRCTVTIARLVPHVSWWFPSCVRCGTSCTPDSDGYACRSCGSKNYRHKYKLLFVASDGTGEAEMICFGQLAQRIIGKPVQQVLRTVRRNEDFPPDIAGIVSHKYTFVLTITNQSFYTRNRSFMVNSIVASYGRQRAIPQIETGSSSHQLSHPRSSAPSASAKNSTSSSSRRAPQPTMRHYTPPRSPATTQIPAQDAPPLDAVDTPITYSARKRLNCDTTEIEEESDDGNPKRARPAKMKGATNTSENQSSTRKRLTYDVTEPDEESDGENKKITGLAKMKGIAETSEDQSANELARKRPSPEHTKTSSQKSIECKAPRSQKNK